MGHNLDVCVLDSADDPVKGAKVKVFIKGFWKGGSLEEFTDEEGHAEFVTAAEYEDGRELTIHVRGQSFGPYSISGGSYTVQLE